MASVIVSNLNIKDVGWRVYFPIKRPDMGYMYEDFTSLVKAQKMMDGYIQGSDVGVELEFCHLIINMAVKWL